MGMFDQILSQALPGGGSSVAKPLMIALGSLAVGRLMGSAGSAQASGAQNAAPASQAAASNGPAAANTASAGNPLGGVLSTGLSGVLQALQNSGHGNAVKSWMGSGQNQPIQPAQLGQALGNNAVSALAQHTGMNEQQLLTQLASALPGVVDKLTANGTLPNLKEIESAFLQK